MYTIKIHKWLSITFLLSGFTCILHESRDPTHQTNERNRKVIVSYLNLHSKINELSTLWPWRRPRFWWSAHGMEETCNAQEKRSQLPRRDRPLFTNKGYAFITTLQATGSHKRVIVSHFKENFFWFELFRPSKRRIQFHANCRFSVVYYVHWIIVSEWKGKSEK